MIHEFNRSLARSHAAEDLPVWGEVYRKAFPGLVAMPSHRSNGEHQAAGIDRSIIRENGKQILIDEKVRFRNEKTRKVYDDIALEFLADEQRKKPGWVCKPLRADYIAYLIAPLGVCHLLPVEQLQQAWRSNETNWIKEYGVIRSENQSSDSLRKWTTISCCVPPTVLYPEIGKCLRIYFDPFEAAA